MTAAEQTRLDPRDHERVSSSPVTTPRLPPGRTIVLAGRGATFVRELPGPDADAPTVILLHGWTATADLNWFPSYEPLAAHARVIAFDLRGHAGGIRSRKTFRLEDCADDVAAVADALGVERFIAVGYSMGGAVAQMTWRRHPNRVAGVVLCATASTFSTTSDERWRFRRLSSLARVARVTPRATRQWLTEHLFLSRKAGRWEPWAIEQASRHDWRMVLEAGRAIGEFSSAAWIGELSVPAAVVITLDDHVVPTARQLALARAIPTADLYTIDGEHNACIAKADVFVPTLIAAVDAVHARAAVADR